jgi:hypothetical protein
VSTAVSELTDTEIRAAVVAAMETIDMGHEMASGGNWGRFSSPALSTPPALYCLFEYPQGVRPKVVRIPTNQAVYDGVSARAEVVSAADDSRFARMYPHRLLAHLLFAELPVHRTPEEREQLRVWKEAGSTGAKPKQPRVRVLMALVDGEPVILQRVQRHESSFRTKSDHRGTIESLAEIVKSLQGLDNAVRERTQTVMACAR